MDKDAVKKIADECGIGYLMDPSDDSCCSQNMVSFAMRVEEDAREAMFKNSPQHQRLRDKFAAEAMQALIASWDEDKPWPCLIDPAGMGDDEDTATRELARGAYFFADSMMIERDR